LGIQKGGEVRHTVLVIMCESLKKRVLNDKMGENKIMQNEEKKACSALSTVTVWQFQTSHMAMVKT